MVLSAGAKKIGVKWIYKTKLNESGKVDKYKARFVVKGYTQEHRIDYMEVYTPIFFCSPKRSETLLVKYQISFFMWQVKRDIFVEQLKDYEKEGRVRRCCPNSKKLSMD